jgi:hypothetical protein
MSIQKNIRHYKPARYGLFMVRSNRTVEFYCQFTVLLIRDVAVLLAARHNAEEKLSEDILRSLLLKEAKHNIFQVLKTVDMLHINARSWKRKMRAENYEIFLRCPKKRFYHEIINKKWLGKLY